MNKTLRNTIITSIVTILYSQVMPAIASDSVNPPFVAICKDINTYAYRSSTDIHGNMLGDNWSTEEHFYSTWSFSHSSEGVITVNGEQAMKVAEHKGVVIVSENPFSNGIGAGIWVYAIQLGLQKIVGSEVYAKGGFSIAGSIGVKTRLTSFDCQFDIESEALYGNSSGQPVTEEIPEKYSAQNLPPPPPGYDYASEKYSAQNLPPPPPGYDYASEEYNAQNLPPPPPGHVFASEEYNAQNLPPLPPGYTEVEEADNTLIDPTTSDTKD
jgi:hypothetical protein